MFPAEYEATSSHKDRHKHDMQYEFAYINYVWEENGSKISMKVHIVDIGISYRFEPYKANFYGKKKYRTTVVDSGQAQVRLRNNSTHNREKQISTKNHFDFS